MGPCSHCTALGMGAVSANCQIENGTSGLSRYAGVGGREASEGVSVSFVGVLTDIFFFLSLLCLLGLQYEGPEAPVYEVRAPIPTFLVLSHNDDESQHSASPCPRIQSGTWGRCTGTLRCSHWSGCGEGFQSYTKLKTTTMLVFAVGEGSYCYIPSYCLCDLWQQKRRLPCFPPLSV